MRVLVLGATGYLGSHISRHLQASGHEVSGLSRSEAGDEKVAATGATPVRGDLDQLEPVLEMAAEHDATIYAAQLLLQPEHDAMKAFTARLAGTGKTLIFTAGTGLLSQRTDGDWSEDSFAEHDPFIPSKYIGFRHVTEKLVQSAAWSGSLKAMVIRPPLIWGNGGCAQIARYYQDAYQYGDVAYLGRGLNLYSNVHVEDLSEVYRLMLEKGVPGALYHAVAGEVNNRTMAEKVAASVGVPVRSVDFDEGASRWGKFETLIGMSTCSRSRSPRTRQELGWRPTQLDLLSDIGHPNYLRLRDTGLPPSVHNTAKRRIG